jgi:hypothetical protein
MYIFWRLRFIISLALVGVVAFGSARADAQQIAPARITEFMVTTLDGKVVGDTPLMAGAAYNITLTIEVAAGLKEEGVIKTSLTRTSGSDRFWSLKGTYPGIDSASWQPGQSALSFDAVEGKVQLELQGSVPSDYVSERLPDGQELHLSKNIAVVELSLASGTVIEDRQLEVIDRSIEEYRNALSNKKELLAETVADPAYIDLVRALIASAEAEANVGYTDLALDTLKAIPASGWVAPSGSASYQWIIVGVLAAVMLASVLLFARARSETSFLKRQTDDQAKHLQILAMRASRIGDSALTQGIEQVRRELEQTGGGS